MHPPNHIAVYISAQEQADKLSRLIMAGKAFAFAAGLGNKKGALYSMPAIREFVKEELLHEQLLIKVENGNSLASASSGEQRRALLKYLLAQKPDYIIAENLFESLDKKGQEEIIRTFTGMAAQTLIIQIIYRRKDLLPFIEKVYFIQDLEIKKIQTREDFLNDSIPAVFLQGNIPPPVEEEVPEENTLVKMNNLSVYFNDRPVLKNINWEIKKGEFWQLAGPNGSGKTTILSIITGDSVKGYGQELYLFGKKKGSGETVWDIKHRVGYFTAAVLQELPRQDSIEDIVVGGFFDSIGLYTQPGHLQLCIARQWLSLLGLFDVRDQPFRKLTLVQQRMVWIARAMIKHPPLLILDEPTSGLDDENVLLFTQLVNKIAAETKTAIVYVSHRKDEGLQPEKILELVPSENGSAGIVHIPSK